MTASRGNSFVLKTIATIILMGCGGVAHSGIPVEEEMICPVGGETFMITETLSCTTMGRTMSFRPITSCDFVTRLPVCPSNGLPIYQDFSEAQIAKLTTFMGTESYAQITQLAPWLRAYAISKHLDDKDESIPFYLLLNALWFEAESFFLTDGAFDNFISEAESRIENANHEEGLFIKAILAFALLNADRTKESKRHLEQLKQEKEIPEMLQLYISAIKACQNNMKLPECSPDVVFEP